MVQFLRHGRPDTVLVLMLGRNCSGSRFDAGLKTAFSVAEKVRS